MTTASKALPADRAAKLERWLRRRVRVDGWQQLAEGLAFLALGGGVMIFAGCAALLGIFLGFWEVKPDLLTVAGVYLLIAAVIFTGSFLTRNRKDYSASRGDSKSAGLIIAEIIFGAPGQLRMSFVSLERCWQLWHCDVEKVSVILLWLFDRRRKATVEEISTGLAGDAVRVLPQLRDISGVIWLTYYRGVIILAEELRREIGAALGENPGPKIVEEPREEPRRPKEPKRPKAEPVEPEDAPSREIFGWYEAMNLPPFAPLSAVRKRYRELVKIHHPDAVASRKGGAKVNSDEPIKRINAAYHSIVENSRKGRRR